MNKKLFTLVSMSVFLLFVSLNFVSAYHNYDNGYYNAWSYTSSRSNGYIGGPSYTTSNDYNYLTTSRYLNDGTFEKTTHYMTTMRESPYYQGYGGYSYPRSYYSYNNNYQPWYQRYWDNSYPRYDNRYNYAPSYSNGYYY